MKRKKKQDPHLKLVHNAKHQSEKQVKKPVRRWVKYGSTQYAIYYS
ncbi:hypothetical protein [Alteribacter natronophilus]|nr:hypothetical protein [Alteribacter natronophilus]